LDAVEFVSLSDLHLTIVFACDQGWWQKGRIVQPPRIDDRSIQSKQILLTCDVTPANV